MPSWTLGKKKKNSSIPTTLERKTAEIKERLARLSFRRHSAPAQPGRLDSAEDEASVHAGASLHEQCDPIALRALPVHVLELILDHLSLQDLAKGAALTHSSWRSMAMSDVLWRSRLQGKIPRPLLNTLKLSRKPWSEQVSSFYSANLISNATFSSAGFAVATGMGRGTMGSNEWRVQVNCWQVDKRGVGANTRQLCETCGGQNKIKVLSLTTPTWTVPEASQEIDLVAALVRRGMHAPDAEAFLDTCPEIEFSVWVSCGDGQPEHWQNGFAAVVLDNGFNNGAAWLGLKMGSQIYRENSKAFWISWVIDPTLLTGSQSVKAGSQLVLNKSRFKKLSCVFSSYDPGVRRAHVLLKGLDPRVIYKGPSNSTGTSTKPIVQFCAPVLRFKMPSA